MSVTLSLLTLAGVGLSASLQVFAPPADPPADRPVDASERPVRPEGDPAASDPSVTPSPEGSGDRASAAQASGSRLDPAGAGIDGQPPPPSTPPGGRGAVGVGAAAPLPAPPPPVDPKTVRRGPWRGRGWLGGGFILGGSVPTGEFPARGNVRAALGGFFHGGWRIANFIGLGAGLTRFPYHSQTFAYACDPYTCEHIANLRATYFDVFVRGYVPLKRRVQPWLDLGGGPMLADRPHPERGVHAGGFGRVALGADFWVSRTVSLDLAVHARMHGLDRTFGVAMHGNVGLSVHF